MSKKANPALIGVFVLGAVALLVAFVVVFGSGRLFRDISRHVIYFDGSISGLRVGANVNFRGVRIGEVRAIAVQYDVSDLSFQVPVIIEIDNSRLVIVGDEADLPENDLDHLIAGGLRAQLNVQSFVTGLLEIQLDFFPDSDLVYRGVGPPFEMPTIPSTAQLVGQRVRELLSDLQEMPLDELIADITGAASGLNSLLNSPDTQALPGSLRQTLREVDSAVSELREDFAGDSEMQHRIATTLNEVSSAARSLRLLADYLERHPESLLRGRPNP